MVKFFLKKIDIIPSNVHLYILIYIVPILHFFKQTFFVTKHEGSSMAIVFEMQVQWQFVSHE